jgi:methyl-accepting chemotaxis protein
LGCIKVWGNLKLWVNEHQVGNLTNGVERGLEAITSVTKTIEEVASIAEESSSASEEQSSAVEEQTAAAQQMAGIAREVSENAETLEKNGKLVEKTAMDLTVLANGVGNGALDVEKAAKHR